MADDAALDVVRRRLIGEHERTQSALKRDWIDEIYIKYGVAPDQAAALEHDLTLAGVSVDEDEEREEADEAQAELPADRARSFADALSLLMYHARRQPRLDHREEVALGEAIQLGLRIALDDTAAGTPHGERILAKAANARERLISSNLRLVVKFVMVRRYNSRMDVDDLVQHGMLGLIRAAEKYDPDWGTRFSTYATWWIRQAVSRGFHNEGQTIRLPVHIVMQVQRLRRSRRMLGLNGGGRGDVKRLAESLAWTLEYTARIAQLADMNVVSLDAPLANGDSEGLSLGDLVADALARPDEAAEVQSSRDMVRDLVDTIEDDRARDIIRRRYGFDGPDETLQEVGDGYKVTRERIRQIQDKTLRKLVKRAIAKGLRGDTF
jgi:RNA polymerase primary sigma factor